MYSQTLSWLALLICSLSKGWQWGSHGPRTNRGTVVELLGLLFLRDYSNALARAKRVWHPNVVSFLLIPFWTWDGQRKRSL
ncbi:hypothetical protein Scep_010589 [Stephania cephalantha]|uniref:Secreted protein n=1 Tax=Stephania cephalantha TaxID=152367 RepID=A0AAP0JVC3_9MAGN